MRSREVWGLAIAGTVGLWLILPGDPPTELSERQRAAIQQKIANEILHGQMLYNLPELFPPPVEFAVRDPKNAAESECDHYLVTTGKPAWRVRINARMAAQHYHEVMTETIPHEVAHLLLCRIYSDWTTHDARWEAIVRDLGATPFPYHNFGE